MKLSLKNRAIGLSVILSLGISSVAHGQLLGGGGGGLPKLNGGASGQIQNGLQVKPPALNSTLRPNLNLNNNLSGSLNNSLNGSVNNSINASLNNSLNGSLTNVLNGSLDNALNTSLDAVLQNRIKNNLNLSIGALGADVNQALNLNANGDLGASLNGLTVQNVIHGSLAQRIGLTTGDQVLAVDKVWVKSAADFGTKLNAAIADNGAAWIYVDRDGSKKWLRFDPADLSKPRVGIQLDTIDSRVSVANVTEGSPAARAGIKAGDQIVSVNGKAIVSTDDVISSVQEAARTGGKASFVVKRDGETVTLNSTVDVPGRLDSRTRLMVDAQSEANAISQAVAEFSAGAASVPNQAKKDAVKQVLTLEKQIGDLSGMSNDKAGATKASLLSTTTNLQSTLNTMSANTTGEAKKQVSALGNRVQSLSVKLK